MSSMSTALLFPDINECLSKPCLNLGICHDEVDGYHCDCQGGYQGTICQKGAYFSGNNLHDIPVDEPRFWIGTFIYSRQPIKLDNNKTFPLSKEG